MFKSFEFWALILGGLFAVIGGAMSIHNRIQSDASAKKFQDSLNIKSNEIIDLQNKFIHDSRKFEKKIEEKNQEIIDLQKEVMSVVDGKGIPALFIGFETTKQPDYYSHREVDEGFELIYELRNNSDKVIKGVQIVFYDYYGQTQFKINNSQLLNQISVEESNKIYSKFQIVTPPINLYPGKDVTLYRAKLDMNIADNGFPQGPHSVKVEWEGGNYYESFFYLNRKSQREEYSEWVISGKRFYYKYTYFNETDFFRKCFERK